MMKLSLRIYDLQLQHKFTISRQSFEVKRTLIVELKLGSHVGYGEASENPYYEMTLERMVGDLQGIREVIESFPLTDPDEFWHMAYPLLRDNMFALCALDMAYHDLYARRKGVKLYELWDYNINCNPLSNYTIGIDTIENMLQKMHERPWPVYKIKLGTEHDLEIVKALRKRSDARFRIDANCAWDVETTLAIGPELKKLGVEFLEQPLPSGDEAQSELFKRSVLPVIADESCQVEEDVKACHGLFHGVNIKLVKCGGLSPARRMLSLAEKFGMKKMVGCMTESSVGISAIAHLAPRLDFMDMDGAMLLKRDIARGVELNQGKVVYSSSNGIGSELIEEVKPIMSYLSDKD